MSHILHRAANAAMPVAVGGKGVELIDRDGKRYLDASGGAAVSCLGHGHPDVLAVLHRQLDTIAYAHTGFFTTEIAEQLADRLVADAPADLDHVYLVSGGSEAIEAALKMAREMATFSPLVLKTLKRFVTDGVLTQGPSEQSGRAQRALHEVKESEDAEEAKLAVKERRKAAFKGR